MLQGIQRSQELLPFWELHPSSCYFTQLFVFFARYTLNLTLSGLDTEASSVQ
jgi:hypothetical protein